MSLEQRLLPTKWTPEHTTAFLLLCAAGVDGFRDEELEQVVPLLERLGMTQAHALMTASEAFDHYRTHLRDDTVEDALMAFALALKRQLPPDRLPNIMKAVHEVSRADRKVTEGEVLVIRLLEEVWKG